MGLKGSAPPTLLCRRGRPIPLGLGSLLESTRSYNRLATPMLFQLQEILKVEKRRTTKYIQPQTNTSISVISSNEEREAKSNTSCCCLAWLTAGEPSSSAPRGVGAAGASWEYVAPPPPMGLGSVLGSVSLLRVPPFMRGLVEG